MYLHVFAQLKFEKSNLDIKFLNVQILLAARNWSRRAFQILACITPRFKTIGGCIYFG